MYDTYAVQNTLVLESYLPICIGSVFSARKFNVIMPFTKQI